MSHRDPDPPGRGPDEPARRAGGRLGSADPGAKDASGEPLRRLDPDLAAADAPAPPPRRPPPAIDTRRYRWTIGILGLVLVIAFSIYGFAHNGVGSPGVAIGHPLHRFVAPLATSGLNLDANGRPRCDPTRPNPHGLNVCNHGPLVLSFFVAGSSACTKQVDALQALAQEPALRSIQFAAVAVHENRQATLSAVRHHRWTLPVAYDRDGSIGDLYGVQVCPMLELAGQGGIVKRRLIGEHWDTAGRLRPLVQALIGK